eukprot:TRINITY_DN4235_c0_g1_i1.p1 TRINITY_DN4235_c0_g1~~TRINITY_DN4235_c0_g1_i1.p1  ORF type:complete len:242 (+),score=29.06 TRINITY_DN4235_c0_g1_i1:68-793(+)
MPAVEEPLSLSVSLQPEDGSYRSLVDRKLPELPPTKEGLGQLLWWIAVTRPKQTAVTVNIAGQERGIVLKSSDVPLAELNGKEQADDCEKRFIEVFHVHCHFTKETEDDAVRILKRLERNPFVIHTHIWHEKNGPHDMWSWELWVEQAAHLGSIIAEILPISQHGFCFHPDTNDEYSDHSGRMFWIGEPDPLDLAFFTETKDYVGPSVDRQTNPAFVKSMGEEWPRAANGKLVSYKAQDRN